MPSQERKFALITGAAQRLGRAVALHLAREGWGIGIHFNTSGDAAEDVVRAIQGMGQRAVAYRADLRQRDAIKPMVDAFFADFPDAYLLVNSASVFYRDRFNALKPESLDDHFSINAFAPILLAKSFSEATRQSGCIVNFLDQKVLNPNPDFFSYTLSKLALANATRLLAMELGPKIRVNGVAPGIVLRSGDQTEEEFLQVHGKTPLGVGPTVEEICRTVSFIAGTDSMTGEILAIDGGRHLLPTYPFDDLPKT